MRRCEPGYCTWLIITSTSLPDQPSSCRPSLRRAQNTMPSCWATALLMVHPVPLSGHPHGRLAPPCPSHSLGRTASRTVWPLHLLQRASWSQSPWARAGAFGLSQHLLLLSAHAGRQGVVHWPLVELDSALSMPGSLLLSWPSCRGASGTPSLVDLLHVHIHNWAPCQHNRRTIYPCFSLQGPTHKAANI